MIARAFLGKYHVTQIVCVLWLKAELLESLDKQRLRLAMKATIDFIPFGFKL
jgi:hypothetical protein